MTERIEVTQNLLMQKNRVRAESNKHKQGLSELEIILLAAESMKMYFIKNKMGKHLNILNGYTTELSKKHQEDTEANSGTPK